MLRPDARAGVLIDDRHGQPAQMGDRVDDPPDVEHGDQHQHDRADDHRDRPGVQQVLRPHLIRIRRSVLCGLLRIVAPVRDGRDARVGRITLVWFP